MGKSESKRVERMPSAGGNGIRAVYGSSDGRKLKDLGRSQVFGDRISDGRIHAWDLPFNL